MNERKAIYRQLQHYFERDLFGLYRWSDVSHREPEPVQVERSYSGRRINQRSFGKMVEQAVVEFDGYTLIVKSPNEVEPPPPRPGEDRQPPKPAVLLYDGMPQPENLVVEGANSSETWSRVTELLRQNIEKGKQDGRSQGSAGR